MPPTKPLRKPSVQPRRNLCPVCHNLDPRNHPSSVYDTESTAGVRARLSLVLDAFSLLRTKEPSEGGCRFCNVLCQALDAFFNGWRGSRQRVNVDIEEKGTINVGLDQGKWRGELVQIYTTKPSRSWSTLGTARRVPLNSGSDDTFNFARKCIQDCLTSTRHGSCKLPQNIPAYIPKRLLDVGRVTAPIRLIDTQGNAFEYVALSHCWGAGSPLATTKANWKRLSHDIPFHYLPLLFQDAIIITRQLGLRYIWIDSLCIIQDSARDWETESFKMGNIYENSYVTISATASSDGTERCLRDRKNPVKLDFMNTLGKGIDIRAKTIQDHHPSNKDEHPAKIIGPLATRAWALQEHVLSTRVLHYTTTELLFECKTSFRCECSSSRKALPTTPALIAKATKKMEKRPDAVWDAWHRVVEQYSSRNLTVRGDKLPAISGIAAKIQEVTRSAYIAGLWRSNLAFDLLWSTSAAAMPDAHYFSLDAYRAPTFSWASLDTPIAYTYPEEEERRTVVPLIALVSSSVSIAGLNPLGAVSTASIHVHGPVLPATLHSMHEEGMWMYALLIKDSSAITIQHDCLLTEDVVAREPSHAEKTVRRAQCGDVPQIFKAPVFCLAITRYDTWISGLVLGINDRNPDCWQRLGTFAAGTDVLQHAKEKVVEIA